MPQMVYGRRPKTLDRRDWLSHPTVAYTGQFIDLSPGFDAAPWDQLQLGSCVSHGCCAALIYARVLAGLPTVDPSRLAHYFMARDRAGYDTSQDTGLEVRDGFASLAKDGVAPAGDWPYDISKFDQRPPRQAYIDAATDEAVNYGSVAHNGVDDMVASGFPVVIGFNVYESFESEETANSGVMPIPGRGEQLLGGHCVVLCSTPKDGSEVGYGAVAGQRYRKARNSWSTDWGQGGYFWYPDAAMVDASDFWQLTTVSAPGPQPVPPSPTPSPAPGPIGWDAADEAMWAYGQRWVRRVHTPVQGNSEMKRALTNWARAKGRL